MNQLNISLGGHAVFNEDILTLQASFLEGFKAMFQAIADSNSLTYFVISGCVPVIVSGTLTVSDGYIYANGEILKFTSSSIAHNPSNYYYLSLQTVDTLPRTYYNTTVPSPKQLRYAVIDEQTSPTSQPTIFDMLKYEDLIQLKSLTEVNSMNAAWIKLTTGFTITATYTTTGSISVTITRVAYKVIGKTIMLMLSIAFDITSSCTPESIEIVLPSAMGITFANAILQSSVFNLNTSVGDQFAKCNLVNSTHKIICYPTPPTAYTIGTTAILHGSITAEIQ